MSSQPCVFTEWSRQAENLLFQLFYVWFSCFIPPRAIFPPEAEEGRASACPIACVDHSAHQNSSWVAPYPGDPAKHLALGSRIVPELWMLEKHSNNSDTDSCCYSNLKSFFFCLFPSNSTLQTSKLEKSSSSHVLCVAGHLFLGIWMLGIKI